MSVGSMWESKCTSTSVRAQWKEIKWCACFPFHVYQLIQQNNLLFCQTLVHFNIILHQQKHYELKTENLLDFKIRGFQDVLAAFIMDDVLSENESFCIPWAKDKRGFDPNMLKKLLLYMHFHYNLYSTITFVLYNHRK
jgi:hypothetical protein